MSVLVRCPDEPLAWGIIELQGTLLPKYHGSPLQGEKIGTLDFNKEGKPTLVVGNHLLVGSIVTLQKPLLVLEKEEVAKDQPEGILTQWGAVAIVRKNICSI